MKYLIRVNASDDLPLHAVVDIDDALAEKIFNLRDKWRALDMELGENALSEIVVRDRRAFFYDCVPGFDDELDLFTTVPDTFDPGVEAEEFRTELDEMVLCAQGVQWRARGKYGDEHVETFIIPYEELEVPSDQNRD